MVYFVAHKVFHEGTCGFNTHPHIHSVLTHTHAYQCLEPMVLEAAIYKGRLTNVPIVANRRPSSRQGQNNRNNLQMQTFKKDLV